MAHKHRSFNEFCSRFRLLRSHSFNHLKTNQFDNNSSGSSNQLTTVNSFSQKSKFPHRDKFLGSNSKRTYFRF